MKLIPLVLALLLASPAFAASTEITFSPGQGWTVVTAPAPAALKAPALKGGYFFGPPHDPDHNVGSSYWPINLGLYGRAWGYRGPLRGGYHHYGYGGRGGYGGRSGGGGGRGAGH
jgi:hypothetical protein